MAYGRAVRPVSTRQDVGTSGILTVQGDSLTKSLDATDRLIIARLTADARLPVVALAKEIGLSRSATQERLSRLVAQGVIQGFTLRAAPSQAGARGWLAVRFQPGFACRHVVPALGALPEIRLATSTAGPVDLMLLAEVADIAELSAVREQVAAIKGVASVETMLVLETHLDRR